MEASSDVSNMKLEVNFLPDFYFLLLTSILASSPLSPLLISVFKNPFANLKDVCYNAAVCNSKSRRTV